MAEIDDLIQKRMDQIDKNLDEDLIWGTMLDMANDINGILSFSEYKKDVKVIVSPNEMGIGSISFSTSALPPDVLIKVWYSDAYYAAFFKRVDDYFDHIIPHTMNESGVIVFKDIDEAEERILDFIANDLYKKNRRYTLTHIDDI